MNQEHTPLDPRIAEKVLDWDRRRPVMVVGDFVADEYIIGSTSRISREAPVLILRFQRQEIRPGGAANAAANFCTLGARVFPVAIVGDDEYGRGLVQWFEERGALLDGLVVGEAQKTVAKTRILAGGAHTCKQQVIRIDRPADYSGNPALTRLVRENAFREVQNCSGLLISDYGCGTVDPDWCRELISKCREKGIPTLADSRHRLMQFKDVDGATPNEEETCEILGRPLDDIPAVEEAAMSFKEKLGAKVVVVTRGSSGMTVADAGGAVHHVPIWGTDEITDVTGAGDTVAAVLSLSLWSGATALEAAKLATVAAGLVVMRMGTSTVSAEELKEAVRQEWDAFSSTTKSSAI